jgi:hypothetical protein
MSKDSSGESLEAILASIRRSLAEQATTVLEEEGGASAEPLPSGAPPADLDAPPIPGSISLQLAATLDAVRSTSTDVSGGPGAEAGPVPDPGPAAIDVAPAATPARTPVLTLVTSSPPPATAPDPAAAATAATPTGTSAVSPAAVGQAPSSAPAVVPRAELAPAPDAAAADPARKVSGEPAPGQADPLWFLGQGSEPAGGAAVGSGPAAGAPLPLAPQPKPVGAPEPRSPPLGAGRGPLPPFFGSSAAGVVKVEMVPDRSVRSSAAPSPPYAAPPELSVAAHQLDGMHTANGEPLRGLHVPPRTPDSAGGMRAASSIFGPPPADGRAGPVGDAHPPQIQALEAMVAELLRPMLRRWLDENMPRLVSAALQAELMARRDPKKP